IGVNVVELIVRAKSEACRDGKQVLSPERLQKFHIQAGQIADEPQAAGDIIQDHRFGDKAFGIGRGNADGGLSFGGNRGSEALVEQSRKNHHRDVTRFAIGDAEPFDEIALDSHALQRRREYTATTMYDQNLLAFLREQSNLTRKRAHYSVILQQGSSKFDYGSHCSAVCSSIPLM